MRFFDLSKKRVFAAIVSVAGMLLALVLAVLEEGANMAYIVAVLALAVLAAAFVLAKISYGWLVSLPLMLALPVAALFALENYTHVITDLTTWIFALNLLFFYLLYLLMTAVLGSVRWGYFVGTLVPMLFGLANYFVVSFRGTPIVPWDFFSVRTAASVADNYSFTLSYKGCFSVVIFIWIILLASKSRARIPRLRIRLPFAAVMLASMSLFLTSMQNSEFQDFFGMDTTLFTINVFYRNNGIAAAFLGNLRFLNVSEPDGYSVAAVTALAEEYASTTEAADTTDTADTADTTAVTDDTTATAAVTDDTTATAAVTDDTTATAAVSEYPNIIVIMNEAFSDLSVWGEFSTNQEVMPFFTSLQEEGIGGNLYVSVKGGNTANTEYEFLTGDTMGFLPTGSVPYQQYVKSETPSLASYLKGLGYSTLAIHPYNASGWDRDTVYEYFGFDTFLSKTDFTNPTLMRGYISDSSAFDKIIEQYEAKEEDERLFVFEVTMQNHGGYSKESVGFDIYIDLTDVSTSSTQITATEKYLTLMNETDKALQELVEYFASQEEPTIILMFGDHQPSDYITNQIRRIVGVDDPETMEEEQVGYIVPFMIWANFEIEQAAYEAVSVNYLSGILLEAAGVPLTEYQMYLNELRQTLPVITANMYMDTEGNMYSWDSKGTFAELLNEYNMLTYNHLVDTKNRLTWFFS